MTGMGERQFKQAVANRRSYQVRPLFAGPELAQLLRSGGGPMDAAAVEQAWRAAAPQRVWRRTRVAAFDGSTLSVAVADPVTRHFLLGQAAALRENLKRVLPRLKSLRFGLDENGFRE